MMPEPKRPQETYRIAGCDLGKAAAKFVIARVCADGRLDVEKTELIEHDETHSWLPTSARVTVDLH